LGFKTTFFCPKIKEQKEISQENKKLLSKIMATSIWKIIILLRICCVFSLQFLQNVKLRIAIWVSSWKSQQLQQDVFLRGAVCAAGKIEAGEGPELHQVRRKRIWRPSGRCAAAKGQWNLAAESAAAVLAHWALTSGVAAAAEIRSSLYCAVLSLSAAHLMMIGKKEIRARGAGWVMPSR